MRKLNAIMVLITILLTSCSKRIEMPISEKEWNPYKAGEVLIFKSSDNEWDTIKIEKIIDNIFPDAPGPLKYYNERLWVYVEHTGPDWGLPLKSHFFKIRTGTPDKPTTISFQLKAKNSVFYDRNWTIDELNSIEPITLKTEFGQFSDVLVVSDMERRYSERENFIERIYWSKSTGYLKFVKKDGKTWELAKKHLL